MSEAELERQKPSRLEENNRRRKKWQIRLIIGGYDVRAYTKGYRFTKDIDLVTTKKSLGKLKALLNT